VLSVQCDELMIAAVAPPVRHGFTHTKAVGLFDLNRTQVS